MVRRSTGVLAPAHTGMHTLTRAETPKRHKLPGWLRAALACAGWAIAHIRAEGADVPPAVQAQLLSKVPAYDRGFRERARDKVHVLVVFKSGNAESERKAQLMRSAVAEQQDIAGLPHEVFTSSYSGASGLTAEVKRRSVSILYVSRPVSGGRVDHCSDASVGDHRTQSRTTCGAVVLGFGGSGHPHMSTIGRVEKSASASPARCGLGTGYR